MTDTKKDTAPSVATVDTPEFQKLHGQWLSGREYYQSEDDETVRRNWSAFIAHIDAHVAAQVAEKDAEIKTLKAALDAQGELTDRYQEIALSAQAAAQGVEQGAPFDFAAHLAHQATWSANTFGPGMRTLGVCDHIRKELKEIEEDPLDLKEWIDVVILALDGAWRCGGTPQQIIDGIVEKQAKNERRVWPDWRTADPTKAIEHDRTHDKPSPAPVAMTELNLVHALRNAMSSVKLPDEFRSALVGYFGNEVRAILAAQQEAV